MNLVRSILLPAALLFAAHAAGAPTLEMEQVLADGKPVAFTREGGVMLPAGRHDLEIRFRTQGEPPFGWIVHYRLDGYDSAWRTVDGEMAMTARMLDVNGRELSSTRSAVPTQPRSWSDSPRRASLNRRLEPVVVPEGAKSLEIVFDSGTERPELMGEWVVAEVTVNRAHQTFGPVESIWGNPMLTPSNPKTKDPVPLLWERRGDPAIARLEKSRDSNEKNYLLRLSDSSKDSAGAWVSRRELPSSVKPGEVLSIGWHEGSRIVSERSHSARYEDVPPGKLRFRAVGRGMAAVYSADLSMPVVIRPYIWTEPWFAPSVTLFGGSALGLWVWFWMRRRFLQRLARFEMESRLEKDRARIARDMHDELGASLTRIALMSDLAAFESEGDGSAARRFGEISKATRSVSSTLDEIVWTVNPRNDTVESLVGYLGEFATEYLESAGVPLKMELPPCLPVMPVASEARHQVLMGVKEALNNIMKYAHANMVTLRVSCERGELSILIIDDGRGFDPEAVSEFSNGLRNMQQRFTTLGGSAEIESRPGAGTTVSFRVPIV